MSNRVNDNLDRLKKRHYVRKATADNYWVDFSKRKLEGFISRFGEEFCLIINGSTEYEDAYVIPYKVAETVLTESTLEKPRNRWIATVKYGNLCVQNKSVPVGDHHNNMNPLDL